MTKLSQPEKVPTSKQVHAPVKQYRYPLRSGNQFELITDGENFFPRMFDDIRQAEHTIFLEMYLSASGEVFTQFTEAVLQARAKNVEVYCLFDDFGFAGVEEKDVHVLKNAGVHIAIYNPVRFFRFKKNLHRTHRKVLIIDGKIAYTGGTGLIDCFSHIGKMEDYWHDVMVRIVGACVDDWVNMFSRAWFVWAKKIPLPVLAPAQASSSNAVGRVVMNRSARDSEIRRSLMQHMDCATERVWLCAPYFVPSRRTRRLIRRCARGGLDVRLLLAGPKTDNAGSRYMARRYYKRLLRAGVKIYEYLPRFVHAKVLLVDDWSSIGSSNLDRWNLFWNLDANQEIHCSEFAKHTTAFFDDAFTESQSFDLEAWQARPLKDRFIEKFWGFIVSVAVRFSRNADKHKLV